MASLSIILGIDPGSRFAGYGFVKVDGDQSQIIDQGVIAVPPKLQFSQKLKFLKDKLTEKIEIHQPSVMSIEKIFLGKSADSAFKLGHARGICMMMAAEYDFPVYEYAARSVKKAVTGTGSATKEHVRLVVSRLLGLDENSLSIDASDALSLALCHQLKHREALILKGKGL